MSNGERGLWQRIGNGCNGLWQRMSNGERGLWQRIGNGCNGWWQRIGNGERGLWQWIGNGCNGWWQRISNGERGLADGAEKLSFSYSYQIWQIWLNSHSLYGFPGSAPVGLGRPGSYRSLGNCPYGIYGGIYATAEADLI